MLKKIAAISVIALTATACVPTSNSSNISFNAGSSTGGSMFSKEMLGTLLLGAGGGALGSQFGKGNGKIAATIAGTLLGGYIGNNVGSSLDKADLLGKQHAAQYALENNPNGSTTTWSNPSKGAQAQTTPTRTYRQNNTYCREYTSTVTIAGRAETIYGTACRDKYGNWRIANQQSAAAPTYNEQQSYTPRPSYQAPSSYTTPSYNNEVVVSTNRQQIECQVWVDSYVTGGRFIKGHFEKVMC